MKRGFTRLWRWIATILAGVMVLSSLRIDSMTASAISCRKGSFLQNYTLTGNMAQDVATIAKSQAGRTGADFGYTEAWCDEFVADCIENAGADSSIVGHGGRVSDFEQVMRNKGAVEVSTPQTGDLVFFTFSHVEIITKVVNGTPYCAGGNNGGTGNYRTNYCRPEHLVSSTGSVRLYLRPNYKNTPSPNVNLFVSPGDSKKLTSFSWSDNSNSLEYRLKIWNGTYWVGDPYFAQWGLTDKTYDVNLPAGYYEAYIDAVNENDMQMSNVVSFTVSESYFGQSKLSVIEGNKTQKTQFYWSAVEKATEYRLKIWNGKCWEGDPYFAQWNLTDTSLSVDLPAGYYEAYIDAVNENDMQMSNVVSFTVSEPYFGQSKLSVIEGNKTQKTQFYWSAVEKATEYRLKIWNGKCWEGDPYFAQWNLTDTSLSVDLPAGYYEAYIDAVNENDMQMSNVVSFTVSESYFGQSKLSVIEGNKTQKTQFYWSAVEKATEYRLKIWNGKCWEGDPYFAQWNLTDTSLSVDLPAGYYEAYIDAVNENDMQMSNVITFTVSESFEDAVGDVNADGCITSADLILFQSYLLGEVTLTESQYALADMNTDGAVNGLDLALMRQKLAS